jgi:hypothetical protein
MSVASDPSNRGFAAAVGLLAAFLSLVGAARAADPEVEALRQRVDELSQSVQELRDQVRSLQGRIDGGTPSAPAPTAALGEAQHEAAPAAAAAAVATPAAASAAPEAATAKASTAAPGNAAASAPASPTAVSELAVLKKAWRQVEPGIASQKVHDLLGAPTQELTINGKLAWYYVYPGIGAGSVFFNDSRRVSSKQSPPLGISW